MSDNPALRKMHIKPGHRLLLLNAPDGTVEKLEPLPEGVEVTQSPDGGVDVVLLFVRDKAEIDWQAPAAIDAVKPGGLLWICYPKKSSGVKTDIHRDAGWETVEAAGWRGIAQVAMDDTWTATRFRPAEDVGRRP